MLTLKPSTNLNGKEILKEIVILFSPACFVIFFNCIDKLAYNLQVDIDPKPLALQLQSF